MAQNQNQNQQEQGSGQSGVRFGVRGERQRERRPKAVGRINREPQNHVGVSVC